MKLQRFGFRMVLGLASLISAAAIAADYSSVQSTFRPSNWQLWDPVLGQVQVANSDAMSQDFETHRATCLQMVNTSLTEGMRYVAAGQNKLDPQRLYFFSDYAPRIYFFMDGGASTSALGVTICPATKSNGHAPVGTNYLVFPNLNSAYSNSYKSQPNGQRSQNVPLLTGDFVQLPTVKAGQQLSLVFFAQMLSGNPQYTYYDDPKANPDSLQHNVAFFPDSGQYIMLSYENTYQGGDLDYNDTVVVIDIGPDNARILRQAINGTLPK